jgi:crotonobetainyl-CoA:carnitine CoA-transferase CaiB-like acyl-CoA transferase
MNRMSALSGIRVLEVAETVSGEYCGKLLADFGAEVIQLEPPDRGSPTRGLGPFGPGEETGERSGLFAYLNTNKLSVAVDLDAEVGRAALQKLLGRVDAVIDDHAPGWLAQAGLDPARLDETHPRLVVCSITPYGQAAPEDRRHAVDLNVFHASGWGYHTPSAPDDARPPLKGPGRFLSSYESGLEAALCVVSALCAGVGDFIDISKQAVMASRIDYVLGQHVAGDMDVTHSRTALDLWGPAAIFACREGFAYLWMSDHTHWAALRTLMGEPAWMEAFPERWLERENTRERVAKCREEVGAWLATQDRIDISDKAQKLGLQLVPVADASDLYRSQQYQHRAFFAEVEHPVLGKAAYPTAPYKLSRTPVRITSAAPTLGRDTAEVLASAAPEVRP